MNKRWRFIISEKMSPYENMALDETILVGLLKGISPQTVRIYDWHPPTISFGHHQKIKNYLDIGKIKKFGFGLVRRPTGGRAVLHYDEVTYSVIADNRDIIKGSVLESYKIIGNILLSSLKKIGIKAELGNRNLPQNEQKKWRNPCFTSTSKYEILYMNKKIIGSAQTRKQFALLQHGSILLNHNQKLMGKFLKTNNNSEKNALKKLLDRKTIAINDILDTPISLREFAEILKKEFEYSLNINFMENQLMETLSNSEILIYNKLLKQYKFDHEKYLI